MANNYLGTTDSIYSLWDSVDNTWVAIGSKVAWISKGAAKNALTLSTGNKAGWFDSQLRYHIVDMLKR